MALEAVKQQMQEEQQNEKILQPTREYEEHLQNCATFNGKREQPQLYTKTASGGG